MKKEVRLSDLVKLKKPTTVVYSDGPYAGMSVWEAYIEFGYVAKYIKDIERYRPKEDV